MNGIILILLVPVLIAACVVPFHAIDWWKRRKAKVNQ